MVLNAASTFRFTTATVGDTPLIEIKDFFIVIGDVTGSALTMFFVGFQLGNFLSNVFMVRIKSRIVNSGHFNQFFKKAR